jgi:hypothetical protein
MAMYMASRPFLECHVRRRPQAIGNVTIQGGQDVAELTSTADRKRSASWLGAPTLSAGQKGTPIKMWDPVLFLGCFGLVPGPLPGRWTTVVGVEVERPQRCEDERP